MDERVQMGTVAGLNNNQLNIRKYAGNWLTRAVDSKEVIVLIALEIFRIQPSASSQWSR
jgi:hypothetical protein